MASKLLYDGSKQEKYRVLMYRGHEILGEATSREAFTLMLAGQKMDYCDAFRRRSQELQEDGFLKFLGWTKCKISGKRAKKYGFEKKEKNLLPGFLEACQESSTLSSKS